MIIPPFPPRPPFPTPPWPPFPPRWWQLATMFSAGALGTYVWNKWRERHGRNQQQDKQNKQQPNTGNNPAGGATMPTANPIIHQEEPFPFGSMQEGYALSKIALKSVAVTGEVHGLLFTSTIRQEYRNETDDALEVIYTFPLAWNTALLGLSASIGEKRLTGQVVEKAEAEKQYEEAVDKGDSAIMVQQSAKGLYTANLGNIKAGETVTVELRCARLLRFEQGRVRLCVPTVISERYGDPYGPGGLAAHESAKVSTNAKYPFSMRISLFGDIARGKVSCPSHGLQAGMMENGIAFELDADAALDRDFVLLMEGVTGNSLAQYVENGEETLVVGSFAPSIPQTADSPLALKILVDCSGSMGGERIDQAKQGLQQIVRSLSEKDFVSYSRFGSEVRRMTEGLLPCTPATIQQLSLDVNATDADMGGTDMESALTDTFAIKTSREVLPVVLCITDGDVWQVEQIIQRARKSGHRVFAIGVGSAPSESLLRELAEQTGGACEFVTPRESMADAVVRMFHRMRGSIAKNVRVDWNGETLWQSNAPRFLYDGETVHAFALMRHAPSSAPVLRWETGDGEHGATADHVEQADSQDLFRLGMARRMEEAATPEEQKDIALKHQLVSDHTSLILVYEREDGDKVEGLPKVQQVPQMVTHGHGCYSGLSVCNFISDSNTLSFFRRMMKSNPQTETEDSTQNSNVNIESLLASLVSVWKEHMLQSSSVSECLSSVQNDAAYQPVRDFLDSLHKDMGLAMDVLWAVLMQWALERANDGNAPDRHSMRLINAALSGVSQTDRDAVKARCEAWIKG